MFSITNRTRNNELKTRGDTWRFRKGTMRSFLKGRAADGQSPARRCADGSVDALQPWEARWENPAGGGQWRGWGWGNCSALGKFTASFSSGEGPQQQLTTEEDSCIQVLHSYCGAEVNELRMLCHEWESALQAKLPGGNPLDFQIGL